MMQLYTTILYQPLFNLLVFFYAVIPGNDLGLAIIGVTLVLKIILFPFAQSSLRSQRVMQALQPKLSALKQQHKNDKAALTQATMDLYKQEKVNPLSSCLPLLIQLPFLIAVYQVFRQGIASQDLNLLYSFVPHPEALHSLAFGFLDLSRVSLPLAALAALAQFWQTRMLNQTKPPVAVPEAKDEAMLASVNKQMMYTMPIMTLVFGATLPSGLMLFWLLSTLFTVFQQWYFLRNHNAAVTAGN